MAKTKSTKWTLLAVTAVAMVIALPLLQQSESVFAATDNIFPSTVTPANLASTDAKGIELGVKFTSDVSGSVTGIRFYKGNTTNGGTHYGHLWSSTGTQLAQAKFANETSSGWQNVNFATPVTISANTVYIAGYYAPKGHYSYTSQGLATAQNNPPLHTVANSVSADGVYKYTNSSTGGYPTSSFSATNYWVDVDFTPSSPPPDTTPPTVGITSPTNGTTVTGTTAITASASDNVAVASVQFYLDGNALGVPLTTSPYTFNWDTTTVANGSHVLSAKATDTSFNVGTSSSITVTVQNTVPDTTSPTVSIASPSSNQTVVGTTAITASATDNVAVASVQYYLDGSALGSPITSSPYTFNWDTSTTSNGSHTLTAKATDTSGNVGTSAGITINVQNSNTIDTIWPATTVPTNIDSNDPNAVNLGVKFQSDTSGYITGIRFYKGGSNNGGTHIGQLWSSTGSLLAQATFTTESSSGWQTVAFSSGVPISANTIYIASYYAPQGHYSYDSGTNPGGFANAVDNPPLHAPASGPSGGNGVYVYGSTSFPTQTYNSSNYWVDANFSTANTPPDTTAPTISVTNPTSGQSVAGTTAITASATDNVAVVSVQFYLDGQAIGNPVTSSPYTVNWDTTTVANGSHVLTAKATDTSGNVGTSSNVTVTVQNSVLPRPGVRGSGPILVLTDPTNPFSDDYCNALLKTEGMPECAATDSGNITSNFSLAGYRTIIMADGAPLTSDQVTLISNWVTGGGTFISMRPNDSLDSLLGIGQKTASTLDDAYYQVNPSLMSGIETQTMQYHGSADQHPLAGAQAMATLFNNANTSTAYPAVTTNTVGAGKAVAYMFDVSKSVMLTRNGNPSLAGKVTVSTDGLPRITDRFGNGWLDTSKAAIPQADELERSLANLIESSSTPRLWYFPAYQGTVIKSALILTGDDHATGSSQTLNRFAAETAASPTNCSVSNWSCYTSTSYAFPNAFSDSAAKPYTDNGFEVSLHMADGGSCASNWSTQSQFDSLFNTAYLAWQSSYPTINAAYQPVTERIHCYGIWNDYASIPLVEAKYGIKADTNSPCWPNVFLNVGQCLYTGTGIPEDYVDANGNLTGVYQFTTQATDENPSTVTQSAMDTLVANAAGPNAYYGYFTVLCHLDNLAISNQCATDLLSIAQTNNIPMVSAKQAEQFWDGRNNTSIANLSYGTNTLSFTVNTPVANVQEMTPLNYGGKSLTGITVGGNAASYVTQMINGMQYAITTAPVGTNNFVASYQ